MMSAARRVVLEYSQRQVAAPAPGRYTPGLRIASHNVQGLAMGPDVHDLSRAAKICDRVRCWHNLRLDVVAVQETHLRPGGEAETQRQLNLASQRLGRSPFQAFWAHAPGHDSHAGVGVLVRSDLVSRGRVQVHEARVARHEGGRIIAVPLDWAGHKLTLVSVYVPAAQGGRAGRARQHAFLPVFEAFVRTHHSTARQLVLLGDWNVTVDQARERFCIRRHQGVERPHLRSQARNQPAGQIMRVEGRAEDAAERQVADALQQRWDRWGLLDAYRAKHPTGRTFTWFNQDAAALLDRILVPRALTTHYLHQCSVDPFTPSDHRLVVLHLLPRAPEEDRGRGLPRYRVEFQRDAALLQRFATWATAQCRVAPQAHAALIAWWPRFKRTLGVQLQELTYLHNRARRAVPAAKRAAMDSAREAMAAFEDLPQNAPLDEVQARLREALRCERECAAACREMGLSAASAARFTWLMAGERPGPLVTALTRPPRDTGLVAALVGPRGLVTAPALMADIAVNHFAAVSAQPACDPGARNLLLDAVRARAPTAAAEEAGRVAECQVSLEEVQKACRDQRPSGCSGEDGLPPGVWRLADGVLQPLLARLFTAIGRTGQVPQGFLNGVVSSIHKKGDLTAIANYRPITLLNTDYRLLTRVLATRFGPALNKVIGPEQTAFLPGRQIGDSVRLLQMLPAALRAAHAGGDATRPSSGAVVFLDIKGAYDTVDRTFLYDVLRAVGFGAFVDVWVRVLLTGTWAVARVNGAVSQAREWFAGVRQGCPLSPEVYLVVPLAVACYFQAQDRLGLRVLGGGDEKLVVNMFADDMRVFTQDATPAGLRPLTAAMRVVKQGANQDFQLQKSAALPVGLHTPPAGAPGGPGTVSEGIPVKDRVESMGVVFTNGEEGASLEQQAEAAAEWDVILGRVSGCFTRLAKIPLSVFGRGFAASSYGISQALYQAEFGGLPSRVADQLWTMAKRLVDRGLAPRLPAAQGVDDSDDEDADDARPRRRRAPERAALPGLKSEWLPGPPSSGGFGLLPFQQHVTARHALAGLRLLRLLAPRPPALPGDPEGGEGDGVGGGGVAPCPPWVRVAAAALREAVPMQLPAVAFLTYVAWLRQPGAQVDDCPPFARRPLCGPLRLLAVAVAALGAPVRVDVLPVEALPAVDLPEESDAGSDSDASGAVEGPPAPPVGPLQPAAGWGPWVAMAPVFGNPGVHVEATVGPQGMRMASERERDACRMRRNRQRETQRRPGQSAPLGKHAKVCCQGAQSAARAANTSHARRGAQQAQHAPTAPSKRRHCSRRHKGPNAGGPMAHTDAACPTQGRTAPTASATAKEQHHRPAPTRHKCIGTSRQQMPGTPLPPPTAAASPPRAPHWQAGHRPRRANPQRPPPKSAPAARARQLAAGQGRAGVDKAVQPPRIRSIHGGEEARRPGEKKTGHRGPTRRSVPRGTRSGQTHTRGGRTRGRSRAPPGRPGPARGRPTRLNLRVPRQSRA